MNHANNQRNATAYETAFQPEESRLAASELDNLLSATDIAVLFLDRKLRVQRFTPRVGELFNILPSERGRPFGDITHKLGDGDLLAETRRVLKTLIPVEREIQSDDGRWYLQRILPYCTVEDRLNGVVMTFVEVTPLKATELALRQSEERYRALIESSAQVVWTTNARGVVVEDSPSWRAFTGQTAEERTGWGWVNAVHPHDRDSLVKHWRRCVESETLLDSDYRVWHAKSQSWHWMHARAVPLYAERGDEQGDVRGWVSMNSDIQQRKQTDAALRGSEERYRLMVENMEEYAIFTMDERGRIASWNVGAERTLGWTEEEALGQRGEIIFTAEDREQNRFETELEGATKTGHASDERWHRRKDGSHFWANGFLSDIRDESGQLRGFAKMLRDETARRQQEEALRESEARLRQLNETLEERVEERTAQVRELAGELVLAEQNERHRIALLLHEELQQQLYASQMHLKLLSNDLADTNQPNHAEQVQSLIEYLADAITITRRLTLDLSPPVLEGEGLVEALRWLVKHMHEAQGLRVELVVRKRPVTVDKELRVLLFQLVRELLFNVVKHAQVAEARIEVLALDHQVEIQVIDEGEGFDVQAIFTERPAGGWGLYSVRERLNLFGGRLNVESQLGAGTHITITAPLQRQKN